MADNTEVIFPHFYKGGNPVSDIKFKIIVFGTVEKRYRAEVLWGPQRKVFLLGEKRDTPDQALESLLVLSARLLLNLKGTKAVADLEIEKDIRIERGAVVLEPRDDDGDDYAFIKY